MDNILVLLIGDEDWSEKYSLPEFIKMTYKNKVEEPLKSIFDIVILDRDIQYNERAFLHKCTRAHGLFVTENARMSTMTKKIFDCKVGKRLFTGDTMTFFMEEAPKYYTNPYGEKLKVEYITVNQMFKGEVLFEGGYNLHLKGDFGEEFQQVLYWKNNLPLFGGQQLDLYFEHSRSEDVHVKLRVIQFYSGSVGDAQQIFEFEDEQLDDIIRIKNNMGDGPMFFSILAKGSGELNVISLHDRYSRNDIGYFLPGGDRYSTSSGEEIFMYFDPGDMQPPLSVYFSGYRRQEGFEGYYMMRKLGCPMLLITDPRLEGGAFYVGDKEFEKMVTNAITGYMKRLGFKSNQLILSGNSMGTFGSLYYGCMLRPHALILGKPLTNMGNVAKNERIERPGGFPTSLDVLLKNFGELTDDAVQQFNQYFWDRFEKADWRNTKFIVSYLYEDDYDPDGYTDLLMHLNDSGVEVYGKGIHGHHNDNTAVVVQWFKSQYNKILREDFGRKN